MSLYYTPNARSEVQREEMVRLEEAGICIFCPEHVTKGGKKIVVVENDTWTVVGNDYPYEGALHHLLLVPREHVESQIDLSPAARVGYWDILDALHAKLGLTYFGLGSRNGDPSYTGATIRHHHIHLLAVNPEHQGAPITLFLSSSPHAPDPPLD